MFNIGNLYFKKDIYKILNVPSNKIKGAWDTGYREYNGNIYIFSNVGIPGRTGHDYNNFWDGDLFIWEGKTNSNIRQPLIQKMIHPPLGQKILLFTRIEDRLPFTFEGSIVVKSYDDITPVKIVWGFEHYPYETLEEKLSLQTNENQMLYEGAFAKVTVNKYERNPLARRLCIEHYGLFCNACNFNFEITYGDLGKGYIHIHHIIPISSLGKDYIINPQKDLVPLCPNCHAMVHTQLPPILVEKLKTIIEDMKLN